MREDRRLGGMAGEAGELAADHFDGALAESLLTAGALAAQPLPPNQCCRRLRRARPNSAHAAPAARAAPHRRPGTRRGH
jgi:hypothetical protein